MNNLLEVLEQSPRLSVDTLHRFDNKTAQECIALFSNTAKASGWSDDSISKVMIAIVLANNPVSFVSDLFEDAILTTNSKEDEEIYTENPDD